MPKTKEVQAKEPETPVNEPGIEEPTTPGTDDDEQELAAARAAAEAAEKPAEEPKEEKPEGDEAEDDKEPKAEEDKEEGDKPETKAATPMIPKPQFDKKIAQAAEADAQRDFWKAKAEAYEKILHNQNATEQQQAKAAEQVVDAAQQARDALVERVIQAAEQYDENELTMAQFKKVEIDVQRELAKIDRDGLLADISQKFTKTDAGLDLFSEQVIDMLEQKHPYSTLITSDKHWDFLTNEAVSQLQDEGKTLGNNDRSHMLVRTRVAELTDTYGPLWVPNAKVGKAAPTSSHETTKTSTTGGRTSMAKDREKKLEAAGKFPPNVNELGGAGAPTSVPTEAALASMTDDEIAALPDQVRLQLLNQR